MKYCTFLFLLICVGVAFGQEERLLEVNGTELNVRIIGRGDPVIVIHGGPGLNHSYFLPHLTDLAREHRLIFIDQRACGKSTGSLDSTQMTLDWFVKDIEAVRKKLRLGKVSVLAHSWGGVLGMLYAARYPDNIRALILTNAVSPKSGEFDPQTNQIINGRYTKEDSTLRAQTIRSEAFSSGDLEAYELLFRISFKQSFKNRSLIDSLHLELPSDFLQKRKVLFFMSRELSQYDFYGEARRIRCKTLIIHGDYDAIPVELAKKIQSTIPSARLVVIKDAGHFPFIEQKDAFFDAVGSFLSGR